MNFILYKLVVKTTFSKCWQKLDPNSLVCEAAGRESGMPTGMSTISTWYRTAPWEKGGVPVTDTHREHVRAIDTNESIEATPNHARSKKQLPVKLHTLNARNI